MVDFLSCFFLPMLLVTFLGALSTPATRAWGNLRPLNKKVRLRKTENYLSALIILLDDDGFLTSLSSCEEDDDSSFFHAVTHKQISLSLSPELKSSCYLQSTIGCRTETRISLLCHPQSSESRSVNVSKETIKICRSTLHLAHFDY